MVITEVSTLLGKLKHDAKLGLCPRYYFVKEGYVNLDDVVSVKHGSGCVYAVIGGVYTDDEEMIEDYLSTKLDMGYEIVSLNNLKGYSFG